MGIQHVKGIAIVFALLVGAPLALWLSLRLSDDALTGLRVEGEPVPKAPRALERTLRERAAIWEETEIEVRVEGTPGAARVTRSSLGASRSVAHALAFARSAGRSGNPLIDLGKWWAARHQELDLRWPVTVDRATLSRFVELEQLRAEELPIAGVSDGQSFALPGREGRALDAATALATLSQALAAGSVSVILPIKRVPAPPPIAMGSPDGALFEEDPEPEVSAPLATMRSAKGPVREPRAWQPAKDDDCYSAPPQRPFCDGPRKVPVPHGPAHELARALGLGELETVGRLIHHGPKPDWIRAAGAVQATPALWPVPSGRFGRGFGYVRREELKHRIHAGVDIVAPRGSSILAAHTGIVAYSDNRVRGYGNLLVIVHGNGEVSLSAHCERIFVFAGERVTRGQVVAEVGMTGLALGPHLHFELRVAGQPVDPAPRFAQAGPAANARGADPRSTRKAP